MEKHLVFVYGTLKSGESCHHHLQEPANGQAKYVGEGKTVDKYPLVIAGRYDLVHLLDCPGVGKVSEHSDDQLISILSVIYT